MKTISSCLAGLVLLVFLAGGCEEAANPKVVSTIEPAALAQGRLLQARLARLERRALGFCILGRQAEALFPDLAERFYKHALAAVEESGGTVFLDAAQELLGLGGKGTLTAHQDEAADLARDLVRKSRSAWLARMVAHGAAGLNPGLARHAMQLGLKRAGSNPDQVERDWDMAGLVLVMSRWAPKQAVLAAQRIKDAWVRSWVWRRLAEQFKQTSLLEMAAADGLRIKDRPVRAMVLASLAGQGMRMGMPDGKGYYKEALKQAAALDDPVSIQMLQGECAARLLGSSSAALLDQAWQVEAGKGARFKALNLAAKEHLVRQPERGKQLWHAALREAMDLELADERARAVSSLAQSMAALDRAEAKRALDTGPRGDITLRSEAASALILTAAGRDLSGALTEAQGIEDLSLRIGAMARMADILRRDEPKQARMVYVRILELASELGADLVPAPILARAVLETGPNKADSLAIEMNDSLHQAEYFYNLAKILTKKNIPDDGRKYLQLCLTTINSAVTKQILDKLRLLGDMGRGWVEIDEAQARRIFEQAAEITLKQG